MRSSACRLTLLAAQALCAVSAVQAAPSSAPERTVIAPPRREVEQRVLVSTNRLNVTKTPLYIKVLSVTVFAGQTVSASGAEMAIYQMAGTTEIALDGRKKTLGPGEAFMVAAGQKATLKAGAGLSAFVTFNLVSEAAVDQPLMSMPSIVTELFRSPTPVPGLEPGRYDLNLTEVTLPGKMGLNTPHYRTGAGLYYMTSGIGVSAAGKEPMPAPAGTIVYAPAGLLHQWGNMNPAPARYIAFNMNRIGTPAVMEAAPAKAP